jgi:predicted DNA-binding transcriptional regulator AlpA
MSSLTLSSAEALSVVRPPQAASLTGLSVATLAKMRVRGDGPPFLKLGSAVAYRVPDLVAWLGARVRSSTSAPYSVTL